MASPIFDHAHQNIFQSTFNCPESVSCKKMRLFHHFVPQSVDLRILQSDWLRAFWPVSQESDFSQVWDLCNNTANNKNFLYRTNSEKGVTKFSNKFKKTLFLVHFLHYWGIFFFKSSGSVTHDTTWVTTQC